MTTNRFTQLRRHLTLQRIVLASVLFVTVAGLYLYWRWSGVPEYWTARQAELSLLTPQQMAQNAVSLEQRVVGEMTAMDSETLVWSSGNETDTATNSGSTSAHKPTFEPTVRTLRISTREANDWLQLRLPEWLANQNMQLPEQFSQPMIAIRSDKLIFALRYNTSEIDQVISFVCDVRMPTPDEMRLKIVGIKAGKLSAPAGIGINVITQHLRKQKAGAEEGSADFEQIVRILEGEHFAPVGMIDSRRQFRLLTFDLDPQGVSLTMRIEPRTALADVPDDRRTP